MILLQKYLKNLEAMKHTVSRPASTENCDLSQSDNRTQGKYCLYTCAVDRATVEI